MTTPGFGGNFPVLTPRGLQQWWVIQQFSGGRGSTPIFSVVMSTKGKPANAVSGPYTSQAAAQQVANKQNGGGINLPNVNLNPFSWLSSLGGMIASGIESGFVSFFKDLWNVVVGPIEIFLGVSIAAFVLIVYFKDDVKSLISAAGGIALAV